ncbi:MAG: OmpH family outer membrane protein [Flavobacteriales bacterium]
MSIRNILLLALLVAMPSALRAQRIAFVDSKYILEQMPDYQAAQQELDHLSSQWQKEIDERWSQIKRMRDAYNAEAILLTDDMKRGRQEDIAKKETEARELQKKRFGVEGDLFKKRQELIQPIQDRIYQAVKEVAGTSYVAIFDIGGVSNNVLYASEKFDKSDSVLRKLGIKPGKSGGGNAGNVRDGEEEEQQPDDRNPDDQGGGKGDGSREAPPGGGGEPVKPR